MSGKGHHKEKLYPNDPCWCGSTVKLKKCHGIKSARIHNPPNGSSVPIIEVLSGQMPIELQRLIHAPREPFDRSGFLAGRAFIDTAFNGRRYRAEGRRILGRPLNETFHEFVLHRLADWLGVEWLRDELRKPPAEKHLLAAWCEEMNSAIRREGVTPGVISSIKKTGNIRSLLAIGYDFYSLAHCGAEVQQKLINRLKQPGQFQGAKHEIATGGIATRAGFEIEWVGVKEKHVEFIGRHKTTGDRAAFEAKSHHRDGVLGCGDKEKPDLKRTSIKVMTHVKEAMEQAPTDIPFVIFDDLNLPLVRHGEQIKWIRDVHDHLEKYNFFDTYRNTPLSALYITNFGWHFHQDLDDMPGNEVATIYKQRSPYHLQPQTLQLLEQAAREYGFVPPKLNEFDGYQIRHTEQ